jgi:hypothetical protein
MSAGDSRWRIARIFCFEALRQERDFGMAAGGGTEKMTGL